MDISILKRLQDSQPRILVVGDIMLDRYTWGVAERVSPEAPVLVLRADSEEVRLGGAASAAVLLRGLGAVVSIAGVLGADGCAAVIRRLFNEAQIDTSLVYEDILRPTTVKERFLGRPEYRLPGQLLRVDRESREPLSETIESELLDEIIPRLSDHQAVVISDYAKGVCTPALLQTVIGEARAMGIPVLIDPERRENFEKYQGATLIKPNRAAAALASGCSINSVDDALAAASRLREVTECPAVVVTLDRDGMVWQDLDGHFGHVNTSASHLRDITGAGDMAHAMLGFCLALQVPLDEAVQFANVASGLEVERDGIGQVSWQEIEAAVLGGSRPEKVVTAAELDTLVTRYRSEKRRIVFTNGCFDLLHVGHVTYLQEAARLGDILVVAINADQSVSRLKGPGRPVILETDRAAMLAALACVSHVIVFEEDSPHALLRRLRPDVLVKGGTYTEHEVVGREVVDQYGGQVCVVGLVEGVSTSRLLKQISSKSQVVAASRESTHA